MARAHTLHTKLKKLITYTIKKFELFKTQMNLSRWRLDSKIGNKKKTISSEYKRAPVGNLEIFKLKFSRIRQNFLVLGKNILL